ncbi:hypothetical protein SCHPADRAFT_945287 [Schizopora paradoxa]|uniref:Uncharacterized protein n=1 Tax=Schizopora paradoxa TaxID=27342 RepID=A0A0H2R7T7_9AGAM|nr:hypothetical protein SCHPADRAFT_945287 [Schizopora paradoxa]
MYKKDVIIRLASRKLFKVEAVRDRNSSYKAILEGSDELVTLANIVFEKYWCTFQDRCLYIDGNPDITEVDETEEKLVCAGCGLAISYNYQSSTQRILLKSWISHTIVCKDLQRKYALQYDRNSYKRVEKVEVKAGKYSKAYRIPKDYSFSRSTSSDVLLLHYFCDNLLSNSKECIANEEIDVFDPSCHSVPDDGNSELFCSESFAQPNPDRRFQQ